MENNFSHYVDKANGIAIYYILVGYLALSNIHIINESFF